MQPVVYTKTVLPNRALEAYVNCYAVRSFDTNGLVFPKAIIADNEFLFNFFLRGKLFGFEKTSVNEFAYNNQNTTECYFTSIQTFTKGLVLFRGEMVILSVHFKPTGFYSIFDISPKELLEAHGEASDILGYRIRLLYEQMLEVDDVDTSIRIVESFLLKKLMSRKERYRHFAIRPAADFLLKCMGKYPLAKLADELNMTQQTMEVQFKNQIGIDPKTFCGLLRFKQAVNLKIYNPSLSWTEIAYSCGFFDQSHLIKDFKKFTDISPNAFIRVIQPPVEQFDKN